MIFVAVGTQKFQINRLLIKLDELVEQGVIRDRIFAQTGSCTYIPRHFESTPFLTKEEFEHRIDECDFVITHSGVNTIVSALKAGKKIIVFPRLEKYHEHVDDHQCQIAAAFEKKNYVLFCKDENDLAEKINEINDFHPDRYRSQRINVVQTIDSYLQAQEQGSRSRAGRKSPHMSSKKKSSKKKSAEQAAGRRKKRKLVLMCGSDPKLVGGGMVSVIKQYLDRDGEDGYRYLYIPTHIETKKWKQCLYYGKAFFKVCRALMSGKVDLVHLHIAERGSFFRKSFLVWPCRLFKVKVILHNHAAELEDFYQKVPGIVKRYMRKTYEAADAVIVLSPQMIDRIRAIAPDAPIRVLYNAVNVSKDNPYDADDRSLLFLGRLGERKGVYDLLDVLERIDGELPEDVKCYLCGDGEIEQVRKLVAQKGLAHRTAHVGWVDGTQKKEIMEHTGINILPSYNEGLPMTILETMAAGIPNISTSIASIPEVIETGQNGYLIQPGDKDALQDAILSLVSDKEKRETFSKASHDLIYSRFSLDAHMVELHQIYRELLSLRK